MTEPRNCCDGCLSLRQGSLAIGITLTALYSSAAVALSITLAVLTATTPQPRPEDTRIVIIGASVIAALCLKIPFNALLIHGVRKDITWMLFAWIVSHGLAFAVAAGGVACALIVSLLLHSSPMIILSIICGCLMGVYWHWWRVVMAHYKELRAGETGFRYRQDSMAMSVNSQVSGNSQI